MVCTTFLTYTQKALFLISLIFIFSYKTNGYPVKSSAPSDLDGKEETRLANGTILGKYVYKDPNGNPVHVKYFADKGGYGVELKSMKVDVSETGDQTQMTHFNMKVKTSGKPISTLDSNRNTLEHKDNDFGKRIETIDKVDNLDDISRDEPFENDIIHPYIKPLHKKKPEYEVFIEDNPDGPNDRCGRSKVKVYNYIEHSKRRARKLYQDKEALGYCSNN